jgi:hypothetical protein
MDLIPILVAGFGRSGTTALMALLGSAPQVTFDRAPPFEDRYLTYFAKLAALLERRGFHDAWTGEELCDFDSGRFGGLPWLPPGGGLPARLEPPPAEWLQALWALLSDRARWQQPAARFYAEKVPAWVPALARAALPAVWVQTLYLFRDPRDQFLSANAFMRARGYFGFGRAAADSDTDHARNLAHAVLEYFENFRADRGRDDCTLVRYEELASERATLAERLARRLVLPLDPAAGLSTRPGTGIMFHDPHHVD